MPVLTVIGGPNGSGKSTLTQSLTFPGRENLLDPDAIATGIAPHDPAGVALTAGRLVLDKRSKNALQTESISPSRLHWRARAFSRS